MIRRLAAVFALALPAWFAPLPAPALDCANATTTADMLACADEELRTADTGLNKSYGAFKKGLDAEGAKLLLEAQRAWIKFRDGNCAVEADQVRGGSLAPLFQLSCLAEMTKTRADQLDKQAKERGN